MGGAYLGEDTIRLGNLIGKENIKKAYCFEPDTANQRRCATNLSSYFASEIKEINNGTLVGERFEVIRSGMWSENENLGFISYGTHASVIAELRNAKGTESIAMSKLDDVVSRDDVVTMIKMDIEGAEIPALQGAKGIILRDKPKLAICIYHMIEDLWNIPLYIHSLVPEYELYVRHHTSKFWDSVVYAKY